jgi:hypothetical protein
VKNNLYSNVIGLVAIIVTSLFSVQALAQKSNTTDLAKHIKSDAKQVIMDVRDELTDLFKLSLPTLLKKERLD